MEPFLQFVGYHFWSAYGLWPKAPKRESMTDHSRRPGLVTRQHLERLERTLNLGGYLFHVDLEGLVQRESGEIDARVATERREAALPANSVIGDLILLLRLLDCATNHARGRGKTLDVVRVAPIANRGLADGLRVREERGDRWSTTVQGLGVFCSKLDTRLGRSSLEQNGRALGGRMRLAISLELVIFSCCGENTSTSGRHFYPPNGRTLTVKLDLVDLARIISHLWLGLPHLNSILPALLP